jgi:dipeptidyl aminopeptidase/acylaminoacyl peptidase
MKKSSVLLVMSMAVASGPTAALQQPPVLAIREVRPVTLPAYDRYPNIAFYAGDPETYARAAGDTDFVLERLRYRSDGLDVFAYLYRPTTAPTVRLPVVVFNRGSYTREEFAPEVLMPANRLARAGFLVIAPMLRGSGGAQGHDEMGGSDLNDIFNIVPVINELPYADTTRMFMYGESRGGIMTLLAAKSNFPARAIATFGAITDMDAYLNVDRGALRLAPMIWPNFATERAAIVESRSAQRWPERINIPLLLMHGGADGQVSPLHAIQLAGALQGLGKPYELKIFYGAYHSLGSRAQERDEEAIRWFRRFDQAPGK